VSALERLRQTGRQSGFLSLMKVADKAIDNSREKAMKQPKSLFHSPGSKPTGEATDNIASYL
jgi:hypothetical protein